MLSPGVGARKREAILGEVGQPTWPPSIGRATKGLGTRPDRKPLNGQVTRWQVCSLWEPAPLCGSPRRRVRFQHWDNQSSSGRDANGSGCNIKIERATQTAQGASQGQGTIAPCPIGKVTFRSGNADEAKSQSLGQGTDPTSSFGEPPRRDMTV